MTVNNSDAKIERSIAIMSTTKVTPEVKREIERYRVFMQEHEYTLQTTAGYVTYLSRFLRWSEANHRGSLEESITDFLAEQQEASPKTYTECRAAVYQYYKMVTGEPFPVRRQRECDADIDAVSVNFMITQSKSNVSVQTP
jgi:hypothetical protein